MILLACVVASADSIKYKLDGDINSLREKEDKDGITLSQAYIHELIQNEIAAGIPAERIVLGGFSQGGAMSIYAGLTSKVKLGGIVALSSWLLLSLQFAEIVPKPEFNKETPIFMGHGDSDKLVPTPLGKLSFDLLKGLGYSISRKEYP